MATKPPPIPRDSIPSKPSILRKVSDPPAKNTMTQGEWTRTAVWAGGIIFSAIGIIWGMATAFADLQDEDEVKERLEPIAIKAEATEKEVFGIKADISGMEQRLAGVEKRQDTADKKMDVVTQVVMESAEYQREGVPHQHRARAKRRAAARAKRVRQAAEAEDGDPLGALESDL